MVDNSSDRPDSFDLFLTIGTLAGRGVCWSLDNGFRGFPMLDFLKPKKNKVDRAVIRLKLRELSQLFNSMDPSPFIDKDLDADAEAFIEGWALEFHVSRPLTLVVHLEQPPGAGTGDDPRSLIESAVQHFFLNKAVATRRELRELLRTGQISLLVGLSFLGATLAAIHMIKTQFSDSGISPWLIEGLTIAGWVGMWRPIEIYLYGWWPLLRHLRIYQKMSRIQVRLEVVQKS